jgi:glutamate synthase (NADPH) small chain
MAERLNNDFQFLDVGRQDPDKKDMRTRKTQFVEIYQPFSEEQANQESIAPLPSLWQPLLRVEMPGS